MRSATVAGGLASWPRRRRAWREQWIAASISVAPEAGSIVQQPRPASGSSHWGRVSRMARLPWLSIAEPLAIEPLAIQPRQKVSSQARVRHPQGQGKVPNPHTQGEQRPLLVQPSRSSQAHPSSCRHNPSPFQAVLTWLPWYGLVRTQRCLALPWGAELIPVGRRLT